MQRLIIYILIIVFLAAIDLSSKAYINHLNSNGRLPIIKGKLYFVYTINKGMAFSKFKKYPSFVKIFVSAFWLLFFGVFVYLTLLEPLFKSGVFLAIVLGGGLGNVLDRLRGEGVIDFITLKQKRVPVFNVADIIILVGTILVIINEVIIIF